MDALTANIRDGEPRDEELKDRIDSRRTIGDSRSPILRRLLWDGVTVDDVLREYGLEFDDAEDREAFIEQAVREYAESLDDSRSAHEPPP